MFHYVLFLSSSSVISQFLMSPLMNPEITTNSSTTMLMAVKILLIVVDSLTPNANTPLKETQRRTCGLTPHTLDKGRDNEAEGIATCRYLTESELGPRQRNPDKAPGRRRWWVGFFERNSECGHLLVHQRFHSRPPRRWMSLRRWIKIKNRIINHHLAVSVNRIPPLLFSPPSIFVIFRSHNLSLRVCRCLREGFFRKKNVRKCQVRGRIRLESL